jgi:purine-binding chemotaxis protein CheW
MVSNSTIEQNLQLVTFLVGDHYLGIPLQGVQEINRNLVLTPVPNSTRVVSGVVNLRGEVVTVLDLKFMLFGDQTKIGENTRNIVVNVQSERVGVLVDRIVDVVNVDHASMDDLPPNLEKSGRQFFSGVFQTKRGLLTMFEIDEAVRESEGFEG